MNNRVFNNSIRVVKDVHFPWTNCCIWKRFQALVQLTTGIDRRSRVESKQIFWSPSQSGRDQSLHAWLQFHMNNILSYLKKGLDQIVLSFLSKYPTVFTKKSKINTRVCGYTLDLTGLVCPALQSRHLITQKYCCSFFPVKIEIFYESCTNIFLFQSHINFNMLIHF